MKVNNVGRTAPAGRGGKSKKSSSTAASFADQFHRIAASEADGVAAPGGLVSPGAILSVQDVDRDGGRHRRRDRAYAEDLLEQLDALQAAVLAGAVPIATLNALANRLRGQPEHAGAPALDAVIREIELRVAVEIAKLERR